jgi:hypothetical protein
MARERERKIFRRRREKEKMNRREKVQREGE